MPTALRGHVFDARHAHAKPWAWHPRHCQRTFAYLLSGQPRTPKGAWRCHRWLIAELLEARGFEIVHLIRKGEHLRHRLSDETQVRDGKLYLCGQLVA